MYLLAPRTQLDHTRDPSKDVEGAEEEPEGLLEEGSADLRRMLELDDQGEKTSFMKICVSAFIRVVITGDSRGTYTSQIPVSWVIRYMVSILTCCI